MSRFSNSSGFHPRDRSPPRFADRRPPPAGPRGLDDGSPSFGREPPRGPRALVDSPRAGFGGGRGRGYGRGDFRDRDRDIRDRERERDFRDAAPFRRDMDRDRGRRERDFDSRDPPLMGFGRGRSRSPPREFRDPREQPGRDLDLVRMRRNSRDSLLSASSGGPDGPAAGGNPSRGASMRGRGRGDWEGGRGRGRPSFPDDREPYRRRSRSRDAWRDRGRDRLPDRDRDRDMNRERPTDRERMLDRERDWDIRERGRDRDIDRRERFDRREDWDSRRLERNERDRSGEPWKRERPQSRASSRGRFGSSVAPVPHTTTSVSERVTDQNSLDQSRPISSNVPPSGADSRRDSERSEPAPVRPAPTKDTVPVRQKSPAPPAPQVPDFGYVAAPVSAAPSAKDPLDRRKTSEPAAQANTLRSDGSPQMSIQPPKGPKADRFPRSPDFRPLDSNRHPEDPARAVRASTHVSDRSPPTAPIAMVQRDMITGSGELHGVGRKASLITSPTFARLPPPAPRGPSAEPSISPRMQPSTIPTGPRAYQQRPGPSPRGTSKSNKLWARSSFSRGPSVSNHLPTKEEDHNGALSVDEMLPASAGMWSPNLPEKPKAGRDVDQDRAKQASPLPPMYLPIRSSSPPVPSIEDTVEEVPKDKDQDDSSLIPNFGPSSDEDEENVVFNQEYLDERNRIFERDMQSLRAEMPPLALEDPAIVSLLLRIQLLGMIVHDEAPKSALEPLPSVEQEEIRDGTGRERVVTFAPQMSPPGKLEPGPEAIVPPLRPRPDIPIESLPFLPSGPPTPISDMELLHENDSTLDGLKELLLSELSKRRKAIAQKNAVLREEYMSIYKPWRLHVWEMDRSKKKKSLTPAPASPPAPAVPVTPVVPPESREGRRYKGNSELDFLNALKASEISAQEELERRRTKMATARPDLTREAVIPDMLEREDEIACIYKDVNNEIDADQAMAVFGFLPPRNDFTAEEHEIFTNAFMAYPKKWGKIAQALPGRTFQQCIMHYYLTKEEIKYKAKLNKRWSRSRRNRPKSSRPKSNALIADLGVVKPDFDGEDEPAPVTDTGRPRRAAAPTFGDSTETEGATPGRRAPTGKDAELIEKPTRRGGRTPGVRGQRRGRVPQSEPRTNLSLAALPRTEMGTDGAVDTVLSQDREMVEKDLHQPPRSRAGRGRAKEGVYVFDTAEPEPTLQNRHSETGYGSLQPTSYWSVPEQRDFPRLLAHFGRDFEGISSFMKTKTTVMVKNYYQRRLDSGQKDFEETLLIAEEKKARGEPTGPLPVPSVAPKRRYEATPSSIVPRTLAPQDGPITETDEPRFASKSKSLAMSPQPMPLQGRPPLETERPSSRYLALAQASTAPSMPAMPGTLGEDASRAMHAQAGANHRAQGPRFGFFTDDRREVSMLQHATPRMQEMQGSGRGIPAIPSELARMESLTSRGYMPGQGPPSLLPSHSRHTSLTQTPGSPTQLPRPDLDISSVHRDPFRERQYYPIPVQPAGQPQSPRPVLSPVKDGPRASATPVPETSRQVPAKRSNIMSILNDEPEEPQPRKRLASEMPISGSASASRSAYPQASVTRSEEGISSGAAAKTPTYSQQATYAAPPRGFSEYPSFGPPPGGSGTSANNDWMARFDPRAQQGGQPSQSQPVPPPSSGRSTSSVAPESSYSPYAPTPSQQPASLNGMAIPTSAPTPPPSSQRSSYPNVFSQAPSAQPTASRELFSQSSAYRPSSPPRASSVAFGSRPEQPMSGQSPSNSFGLPPRQTGGHSSYSPATSSSATTTQAHGQSYQQHVQTLVNGSHQTQRATSVSLPGASQYGRRTPPPAQAGRSMPSLATLGRSYTPPSALHPHSSGISYAPPSLPASGPIPPLHQRPAGSGSLGESSTAPGHHRVYSQGSPQGGLPGSLHPSSQPP